MRHQDALRSTLKQLLLQRNVKTVKQLIALHQVPGQFHMKDDIFPFFLYISLDVIALWILHSLRLIHRNVLVSKQIIYKSNLLHFQWVLFWKLSVLFMGVVTCCSIQSIVIMP